SPKQHVAHFILTCNYAGTYGSMVKQFVCSLKEGLLAFRNLPTPSSKDEPMWDYIERWNLVLNCKEDISKASSIDMCVQGMHWGLLYSIKSNMPLSFAEFATWASDLELQIA
ncbi:LOW QUALITY PROTEIN: hypothetical protein CFOL_v3_23294, partial [Cephalotus follicularis]